MKYIVEVNSNGEIQGNPVPYMEIPPTAPTTSSVVTNFPFRSVSITSSVVLTLTLLALVSAAIICRKTLAICQEVERLAGSRE